MRGKHKARAENRRSEAAQQREVEEKAEAERLRREIEQAEQEADDLALVARSVQQKFQDLRSRDAEQIEKLQTEAERLTEEARALEAKNERVLRELRGLARDFSYEMQRAISYDAGNTSRLNCNEDLISQAAVDVVRDLSGKPPLNPKRQKFRQWRKDLEANTLTFDEYLRQVERTRRLYRTAREGYIYGNALVSVRPRLAEQWKAEHPDQIDRVDEFIDENLDGFVEWVRLHW